MILFFSCVNQRTVFHFFRFLDFPNSFLLRNHCLFYLQ
uniref:Uncharacterized protein MANES_13G062200 n=1 Tax=Rhizophora mucronata TaxID=61149 RepID=A0A2P2K406_RHIMU